LWGWGPFRAGGNIFFSKTKKHKPKTLPQQGFSPFLMLVVYFCHNNHVPKGPHYLFVFVSPIFKGFVGTFFVFFNTLFLPPSRVLFSLLFHPQQKKVQSHQTFSFFPTKTNKTLFETKTRVYLCYWGTNIPPVPFLTGFLQETWSAVLVGNCFSG